MNRYEFSVLRYRHDLISGEFVNIGIALFDVTERKLIVKLSERYTRLSALWGGFNGARYRAMMRYLEASLNECSKTLESPELGGGPDDLSAILKHALSDDDLGFQASEIRYGVSETPANRTTELFERLVERYAHHPEMGGRDDQEVGRLLERQIRKSNIIKHVQFDYAITSPLYEHKFKVGWKNGKTQVTDPISFDLKDGGHIVEKALQWTGRLGNLGKSAQFAFTAIVAPPSNVKLNSSVNRAVAILKECPNVRSVIYDRDVEEVVEIIRKDTAGAP